MDKQNKIEIKWTSKLNNNKIESNFETPIGLEPFKAMWADLGGLYICASQLKNTMKEIEPKMKEYMKLFPPTKETLLNSVVKITFNGKDVSKEVVEYSLNIRNGSK